MRYPTDLQIDVSIGCFQELLPLVIETIFYPYDLVLTIIDYAKILSGHWW